MPNQSSSQVGLFIPTNYIWDVAQLQDINVNTPEFKELLVRMYQNINAISLALNIKDSGYYDTNEFVNGQLWFPNPAFDSQNSPFVGPAYRQVYRKVINFGALPNTATTSVPHNIICTAATSFTRIYAVATNPSGPSYLPIPYASATSANIIELNVDGTNVNITTGADRTAYTICYVILEYIQT